MEEERNEGTKEEERGRGIERESDRVGVRVQQTLVR